MKPGTQALEGPKATRLLKIRDEPETMAKTCSVACLAMTSRSTSGKGDMTMQSVRGSSTNEMSQWTGIKEETQSLRSPTTLIVSNLFDGENAKRGMLTF